ncbi:hypothetical protein BP6252_03409 [Coleophoma cylindrospora]|uniref:HMG box domain-containing protein n=1 Tax=Coleophoma cylindrospora TaxID=1849047 RepID=A0A3D8S7K7_9HELO|nr:hypothetical protein BP6252_03409 [Coleophoma cylindrospora]
MSDLHRRGAPSFEIPRSPVSNSTDSSRRDSLRAFQAEKGSEPPTPNSQSPPFRLTRKRAASIDTDGANQPRIGDLALNTASSAGPPVCDSAREQVCLCQPDPKIPRPRNAFILYRQHYQAQVVAQHPGLANPEISKIIGEKWRETAPEVKNDWKRLAEEEKQRHQRQYPGYRYQPRRAGKPNGVKPPSFSSPDEPIRCPKCNGRYISTPSTPLTPFTSAFGSAESRNDRLLPPFTPTMTPRTGDMSRYSQDARMDSPHTGPPHPINQRRGPYPPPQPLQTLRERAEDLSLSPDQKRRRFNEAPQRAYPSPSPISYTAPQGFSRNAPPMSAGGYRAAQQFTSQGPFARSGTMGPPTQSSPLFQQPRHPYPTRSNTFDESLRLPPLQTQLGNPAPTTPQNPELRLETRDSQARSVEAMVMTIPYLNKIKVLSKISGPLPSPGPTSPAQDVRGAIIAVEGVDTNLVTEIGAFLNDALSKEVGLAVKTWTAPLSSPVPRERSTPDADTGTTEASDELSSNKDENPFIDYLGVISKWHSKSQSIVKHITTSTFSETSDPGVLKRSPDALPKLLPVALLPEGYSLTTSDSYALRIPINDSYAPVDHWQWMATLWRGIVGPDLTVYVKKIRDKEEFETMTGVELRKDCAAIIVRVMEGSKLDEKSARRLAFEVSEYVRGVDSGLGGPRT